MTLLGLLEHTEAWQVQDGGAAPKGNLGRKFGFVQPGRIWRLLKENEREG